MRTIATCRGTVLSPRSNFHSMRHTFKGMLVDASISMEFSEAMAGKRYADPDAEPYDNLKLNYRQLFKEDIEKLSVPVKLLDEALQQRTTKARGRHAV
ncbi:MAG: hypothetical protein JWP36_504 [Paucimonas sp.]|nr:hypothetical protein [Paucimonas sp.]